MELLDTIPDSNNLKTKTKHFILNNIIGGIPNVRWGHKILILDKQTMRIVDSVVQMNDITSAGVSDVCIVTQERMPLPKLDAIYFVAPTEANVLEILQDFVSGEAKYKRLHVFFTSRASDDIMRKLASKGSVMARIRTLKEAHLEYLVYDSHTFQFDTPKSFFNLYSTSVSQQTAEKEQNEIADKLATVMATLGDYPIIRHAKTNKNCMAIASLVNKRLEQLRKNNVLKPDGSRGVLVVLDRTHDLMCPLVHELTYQAMVEDLIRPPNDVYSYSYTDGDQNDVLREAFLNENDPIWNSVRNMHIQGAKTWITTNFKKFREENKEMGGGHDLTKQLRAMPKFQSLKAKFSVHINLTKECMDNFNKYGLEMVCNLEQDLACGIDQDHKKLSGPPNELRNQLQDNKISKDNRLRLLLLDYVSFPKERGLLDKFFMDEEDKKAINNYVNLLQQTTKQNFQRPPKTVEEYEYTISRYKPILHDIITGLFDGSIHREEYPFLNGEDESEWEPIKSSTSQINLSKKSKTSAWGGSTATHQKKVEGPRIIIFVAGGVTYSEIRTAHLLSEQYGIDVVLGSTHILDPLSLLKQTAGLSGSSSDRCYKSRFIGEIDQM